MIKRVIEQIFQDHAAESLRKTLAEVERAASGKLHNESLADYVTRLASFRYDAEKTTRELEIYREENERHHAISAENGRVDEEPVEDYMVRIWTSLDVAQRFAEDQKEKLQAANKRIDSLLCEPADSVQTLRDLEATANDNGRKPDEAVREFMTRTVAELTHAQTAIKMIQNRAYIYNCKKDEPVIDFLSRMNGTLNELRQRVRECDDAAEKTGCGKTEETAEFIVRMAAERNEARKVLKAINDAANVLGRAEDESVSAFMSRMSDLVAKEQRQADESRRELSALANERAQEISKLRGTHADDIARIDKLSAQLAEIEAEATECGRDEGESVPKFMSRLVIDLGDERALSMEMTKALAESKADVASEHERGNRINSEYEASIANIMAAANKLGRADYEAPDAFMQRQASEIARLRSRVSEEINDAYKCAGMLGRLSTETVTDFMKRQHTEIEKEQQRNVQMGERLSLVMQDYQDKAQQLLKVQGWHEENLQKIKSLEGDCARLQHAYDEANEERKVSKRFHALAVEELETTTKRLQAGEFTWNTYGQLCNFATSCGMTGDESVKQFIERKIIEASTVAADRDRIRAELAAILAEANKSGRCNGDPVQLIKQGQADLDALTHFEKDNAKLDALVSKLQGELAEAKAHVIVLQAQLDSASHRVAKITDEFGALRDRASEQANELSEAQLRASKLSSDLEAILKTANERGRAIGESVSALIERLVFNNAELRKARDGYQPVELELRKVQTLMVRIEGNTARAGRADGEDLVDFIWRQQHEKGLARDESAKEIARLSALVADLQVELDQAKGQYGGIMAQLGNETPLQLIERMQRLAQDRRASTIPHDERAMLVFESADLRKRLEESQKAHAKTEHELRGKLRAALATVENQSAAIAEAKQATDKYTAVVEEAAKLKDWASTIRHKVLVAMVHTKAMAEYDTIMKELDGGKVPQ